MKWTYKSCIGRKLAIDYIPHWQNTVKNPADPMIELARYIVNARKVVFSGTLQKSEWDNTEIAKGELALEINNLKNRKGKNIIVYGGSSFVSSLIGKGLIDEYHLFINPVALGTGVPIFSELHIHQHLKLKKSITYPCDIVLLRYKFLK